MTIPKLGKILYIEDEPDVQNIVLMALEDIGGYEMKICGSGKEAFETIKTYKPDLFLVDVMLPDMDGPTVLKKIKENPELEKVPAVFITAKTELQELVEFKSLNVLGIIRKPFDPIAISETISSLWNEYYKNKI